MTYFYNAHMMFRMTMIFTRCEKQNMSTRLDSFTILHLNKLLR
ncbi:protein of unknown function [Legionella micdadei]|uniref:Uncharacterized protein n=1 Tax=Legionella micdadei TaxID=451 RepID=A0A098GIF5_LEGMI|nr:protein of unknown function [Legionella micdadei]